MADKDMLKKEARTLAEMQMTARNACYALLEGRDGMTEGLLNQFQDKAEEQRKKVLACQAEVEECRDKTYWWSLPFDARKAPRDESGPVISLPGAVYSVQKDFDPRSATMGTKVRRPLVSLFLDELQISRIVLYLDRKFLKEHLHDTVTEEAIVAAQPLDRLKTMISNVNLKGQNYGSFEMQRDLDDLEFLNRQLPREMERLNAQWDLRERIRHESFWENETAWMLGELDSEDYFRESIWRENALQSKKEKYEREMAQINFRLRDAMINQKENEGQMTRRSLLKNLADTMSGDRIRLMRCGYVYYLDEKLVAIVLPTYPEEVYEVVYSDNVNLSDIHAMTKSCRKTAEGMPDYDALIGYIMSRFGPEMKAYPMLSVRPKGASDGLWQCWAENRFLYDFLERRGK